MNPLLWPRWAQGAALIVAGIAAFMLWLALHDRGVVKKHDAEQRAKVTEKTLKADREAGAKKSTRDRAERKQLQDLQEQADEAYDAGDSPLDAVWGSLFDHGSAGTGQGEAGGVPPDA